MPETGFERRRGISGIEIRHGFAQVTVCGPGEASLRLKVLQALADAGVSHKFLKLVPGGLSCIFPEELRPKAEQALAGMDHELAAGRSIVQVLSPNLRDEEGLLARIVQAAIDSGAAIHHMGDMHDRAYLVVATSEAERLAALVKERAGA